MQGGGGEQARGWKDGEGSRSRPLRDSPSIRAHDSSAGPEENCAASAQGSLAGRSRGPQQNSNFPFISAASLAILKGWRSAVGSQANWIWASSSRAREGRPDGGGAAEDPGWAQCERLWSLKPDPEVTTLSAVPTCRVPLFKPFSILDPHLLWSRMVMIQPCLLPRVS